MAVAMSSSWPRRSWPSRRMNRRSEIDLSWKVSAPESLTSPLEGSGLRKMNQAYAKYAGFQSVMGTTMRKGSRPTLSWLMTTAGRTLPISAPVDGSKSINQISPRVGCGGTVGLGLAAGAVPIEIILAVGVERGQLRVLVVFAGRDGGRAFKEDIPLLDGQSPDLGGRPPGYPCAKGRVVLRLGDEAGGLLAEDGVLNRWRPLLEGGGRPRCLGQPVQGCGIDPVDWMGLQGIQVLEDIRPA